MTDMQALVDAYYLRHGPCCAGCDHWRYFNSSIGECLKSRIAPASERVAMIGIVNLSMNVGAGHAFTWRNHVCGNFVDTYEWQEPRK